MILHYKDNMYAVQTRALGQPLLPCRSHSRSQRIKPVNSVAHPPVESSVPFDKTSFHLDDWAPASWRQREALQQPNYPDQAYLKDTVKEIEKLPPLVFAGECRLLQTRLAAAAKGDAFLLFGMRRASHASMVLRFICRQRIS